MKIIVAQVIERIDAIALRHVRELIRKALIIPLGEVPETDAGDAEADGKSGEILDDQTVLVIQSTREEEVG